MNHKQDYPYKDNGSALLYGIGFLGFIVAILAGVFWFIKSVIIPNVVAIINWFVPNFWSMFGYIIIIWILFKIASFIWYPIYSILGKYSYLILLATAIYIIMQIN